MRQNKNNKNNWPDPLQVVLSGFGGQGLILAGIILAAAAIADGHYATQTQTYGPEARGGSSTAEVIISSQPIDYPYVERPDILLALTLEACSKYHSTVSDRGLIIVDSLLVDKIHQAYPVVLQLPIIQTAKNMIGKEVVANIVALGALNAAAKLVSWQTLETAMLNRVPAAFIELNQKALDAGRSLV